MDISKNVYVHVHLVNTSEAFAHILNEMAEYLEGYKPPPDHWDESKRNYFYQELKKRLSIKAKYMIKKLHTKRGE